MVEQTTINRICVASVVVTTTVNESVLTGYAFSFYHATCISNSIRDLDDNFFVFILPDKILNKISLQLTLTLQLTHNFLHFFSSIIKQSEGCSNVVLVCHSFSMLFDCSPCVTCHGPQATISNTLYLLNSISRGFVYTNMQRICLMTDLNDPLVIDSSDSFCVNSSLFFFLREQTLCGQFPLSFLE